MHKICISKYFHQSLIGIPLTIQSNRPSSRSSQRSTGSISSYSGRRHSKGVSVSQSRQGQARSAAILLYSYHLDALRDQSSHSSESHLTYPKSSSSLLSNEIMMKHIEQQIEEQKRMLFIDLPELRNHNTLMRKLRLLPRSEFDLSQLDKRYINIRPLHNKLQRRFFNKFSSKKANVDDDDEDEDGQIFGGGFNSNDDDDLDERSVFRSNRMFVNKSADMIEMAPLPNQILGYSNPLAYSFDDIDADGEEVESINDEEFHRYFIDDEVIIIGALPTPTTSNGPSIAVCKKKINSLSLSLMRSMCRKLVYFYFFIFKFGRMFVDELNENITYIKIVCELRIFVRFRNIFDDDIGQNKKKKNRLCVVKLVFEKIV
jgi:hypothetical protein